MKAPVLLALEAVCSQTQALYLYLGDMLPNSQWSTAYHTLKMWALYLRSKICRLGLIELDSNGALNNQNLFSGKNTLFPSHSLASKC